MQLIKIMLSIGLIASIFYFSFLNLNIDYVAIEFIFIFWFLSYYFLIDYQLKENKIVNKMEYFINKVDKEIAIKQIDKFQYKKGLFIKFSFKKRKFVYNFDLKKIYIEAYQRVYKKES